MAQHHGVAALQIGVADEAVRVQGNAVDGVGGVQQAGARVDQAQAPQRVAQAHVVDGVDAHVAIGGAGEIADQARAVSHGGRTKDGQHQVRTLAKAPHAQRGAEVVRDLAGAIGRGHVKAAAHAHGGVEQEAAQRVHEVVATTLQEAVRARPEVGHVAEDVVHATAHGLRRDEGIGLGDRLEYRAVDRVIELVNAPVEAFPRIARVRVLRRGAAGHQGTRRRDGGNSGKCVLVHDQEIPINDAYVTAMSRRGPLRPVAHRL
ncbi:hypothetical protein D3C71_1276140 [compost metagenome]